MSATALRWCAVPLGLLAFAMRLATNLWWQPVTWRFSGGIGFLMMAAAMLVTVGIPFGIFALLSRGYQRPARFAVSERGFKVSSNAVFAGSQAILFMFLGGGLVLVERVPYADSMRIAEFESAWLTSSILAGVFVAAAVAFLVAWRPQLLLDPEGLTIRRLLRSARLAWDELSPGGPLPPAKKTQRNLELYQQNGRSETIPIGWLDIDPTFLAAAIQRYVEHPQDRAAIGTAS